jgi:hypothetical protein
LKVVRGETQDVEKNLNLHSVQNQLDGNHRFAGSHLTNDVSHEWHESVFQ